MTDELKRGKWYRCKWKSFEDALEHKAKVGGWVRQMFFVFDGKPHYVIEKGSSDNQVKFLNSPEMWHWDEGNFEEVTKLDPKELPME